MTKDIEGSVVFVSSLRNATDCSNSDSSADSSVQGILVSNAIKTYGVGKNKFAVLNGIDMSVKKGTM
jgi:hypothetical protein